jgi:hypothetical protein
MQTVLPAGLARLVVRQDVETLAATGLVQHEEAHVSAPYDAISAEMRL